jgi:hypothetical protein
VVGAQPNGPVTVTDSAGTTRALPVLFTVYRTVADEVPNGLATSWCTTSTSLTRSDGARVPSTRACTRSARRRSSATVDVDACWTRDVMTPAEWSPGEASAGTVIVKGTSRDWPGSTVTVPVPRAIHAPRSVEVSPAGSRSSCPDVVVNASAA